MRRLLAAGAIVGSLLTGFTVTTSATARPSADPYVCAALSAIGGQHYAFGMIYIDQRGSVWLFMGDRYDLIYACPPYGSP
jgi:hypothetical protein